MSDFFMTLRSKGLKSLSGVTLSANATGQSDANISPATISRSVKNCKWLKNLRDHNSSDHIFQSFDLFI